MLINKILKIFVVVGLTLGLTLPDNARARSINNSKLTARSEPVDTQEFVNSGPTTLYTWPSSLPATGFPYGAFMLINAPQNILVRFSSSFGSNGSFSSYLGNTGASGVITGGFGSSIGGTAYIYADNALTGERLATGGPIIFTNSGNGSVNLPPPQTNPKQTLGMVSVTFADYKLDGAYPSNVPDIWGSLIGQSPVRNKVSVRVNWKGMIPGRVEIRREGKVIGTAPANSDPYSTTDVMVDMIHGLPALGRYSIQVVAYDSTGGNYAESSGIYGRSYQIPDPMMLLIQTGNTSKSKLSYDLTNHEGQLDFEIAIPAKALSNLLDLAFDDSKIGWKDLQINGTFSLALGGNSVEIGVGKKQTSSEQRYGSRGGKVSERQALNGRIWVLKTATEIDVGAHGSYDVLSDGKLGFRTIAGYAALKLAFTEKYGVLSILKAGDLIAAPAGSILYNFAKPFDKQLQNYLYAYIQPTLTFGGEVEYDLKNAKFSKLGLNGGVGMEVGIKGDLSALGMDMGGAIGLEGTGKFFLIPTSCVELKTAGYGKLWAHLLVFEKEVEGRAEIKATSNSGNTDCLATNMILKSSNALDKLILSTDKTSDWHMVGGGYVGKYAQTVSSAKQSYKSMISNQNYMTESAAMLNVFTYTEPSLVSLGDQQAMMIWTHDVPTRPIGQNTDIAYMLWNGSAWTSSGRVTDDAYPDMSPKIAQAGSKTIAVWTRINDSTLPPDTSFDVTTTRKSEIAFAVYDSNSQSWSMPSLLTSNTTLDYAPVIAGSTDGSAFAAWIQNTNGYLPGTDVSPDEIMVSSWSETTWETPITVASGLLGLGQIGIVAKANGGDLVFAETLASSDGISQTTQLFRSTFNGSAWSSISPMTPETENSSSPQLVYDNNGVLLVTYLLDGRLSLLNTVTNQRFIGPAIDDGRFNLAQSGDGTLVAIFSRSRDGQYDLYYSTFYPLNGSWSEPQRLTQDRAVEWSPAVVSNNSNGQWLSSFARTAAITATHIVTDSDGGFITSTIQERGQTDLIGISWTLVRNLTVDSIKLSDDHPLPGESVTATAIVSNSGDLALTSFQTQLLSNGQPFATITSTGWLTAGVALTISAIYTPPVGAPAQQLSVLVDADGVVNESNETDNSITKFAFGPDLVIDSTNVEDWGNGLVGLRTLILNIGTGNTSTTTLDYHADDVTGTLVVSNIVPPMIAGSSFTLITPFKLDPLPSGIYTLTAVVNSGFPSFGEVFTNNNTLTFQANRIPDIALNNSYIWLSNPLSAQPVVTVAIFNNAAITATNIALKFFNTPIINGDNPFLTRTLTSIGPSQVTLITATIQGPILCGIFVIAENEMALMDSNPTNNAGDVYGMSACHQIMVPNTLRFFSDDW